ncbi:Serine protease snake [Nymphon striatum]|nr:Serine protease snake [Nymphon striatum]
MDFYSKPSEECFYSQPKIEVKRIIGGKVPWRYEYPMMAGLIQKSGLQNTNPHGRKDPLFCGGALITESYVMTAAHCLSGMRPESLEVSLGDFNLVNGSSTMLDVSSITIHPNFTAMFDNDIAVVKLSKDIVFSDNMAPSTLPPFQVELPIGSVVLASGWGYTSFMGVKSNKLRDVQLQVYNNTVCSDRLNVSFTENMICAGDLNGGHDACQGDSGGPLVLQSNGKKIVVGIVSFGRGCGFKGLAAGYTNVSRYIDWIHSVTNDSECKVATQSQSEFGKKR